MTHVVGDVLSARVMNFCQLIVGCVSSAHPRTRRHSAEAGLQGGASAPLALDSRLRGNDGGGWVRLRLRLSVQSAFPSRLRERIPAEAGIQRPRSE